jgi:hypothetical protein
MTTIALSILGIVLASLFLLKIWPELGGHTITRSVNVTRPVTSTRMTKQVIKVEGKDVEVEVPIITEHQVFEAATRTATVPPTLREQVWLYSMIGIAGFVLLFAIGTTILWFYFLVRNNGDPPSILTEMLKYLVASLLGIFVGFMGGSSVTAEKQANAEKHFAPPPIQQPL